MHTLGHLHVKGKPRKPRPFMLPQIQVSEAVVYKNTPKMMMTINLESCKETLIAKEEKSYENSLSEAKDTVSRWYDDTGWPGQIPV